MNAEDSRGRYFDVIVCGGGLAGLTLARQLRLTVPQASVALLEPTVRPLPEAAHKVGESSVEMGAFYFGEVLQLREYLERRHLPKLGLRFFLGDAQGPFEDRPELGPGLFPLTPSYQIDRGRLENDLRTMVQEMGVQLLEGHTVKDIHLADGGEPHEVVFRRQGEEDEGRLRGRWVVDAMGRRRYLQRKLQLSKDAQHPASAAWWRVEGRLDLGDLVPPQNKKWHNRVYEDRNLSTTHLMGCGYWVWLIPLSSGNTSVGIVTDESIHPLQTYGRSFDTARQWLERYEPSILKLMGNRAPLDFRAIKNYSYHSQQVFSHNRWTCVGEAGVFIDPFYSPGSDFIGMSNTITTTMIKSDLAGQLTEDVVDHYNEYFLDVMANTFLDVFRGQYAGFGHSQVFTAKYLWDVGVYWSPVALVFFQRLLENPQVIPRLSDVLRRHVKLHGQMCRLFIDWARLAPSEETYDYLDYAAIPLIQLFNLDLQSTKTTEEFFETIQLNLDRLEELAVVFFSEAVKQCLPDQLPRLQASPWVNAWAVSLDPDRWEADGLFAPDTRPRSLSSIRFNVLDFLEPQSLSERVTKIAKTRIWQFSQGPVAKGVYRWLRWRYVLNRNGYGLRKFYVRDRPSLPVDQPAEAKQTVLEEATIS